MSDSDLMDSKADVCGGASSSSGSSVSPRTPPNCARCKNHGLKINLKGHKRYCKYRCCNCEKCRLTSDRQKIMALQTSWRRAQAQDEARSLLMGEVPPIRPVSSFLHHHLNQQQINKIEGEHSKDRSEPAPPQPSLEGSCDSSSSPSSPSGVATSTILRKLTPIQANGSHMPFAKQFIRLVYPFRNLDFFTQAVPFAPTTYLPFSPIYLRGNGFCYSQICSTTTTRSLTTDPLPRPRSRSRPIGSKPRPANIRAETSST
ncbi:protein doublesex isoform X2 [Eupeodes corollae]|uniref:protein doublesex isoform X2 n=1 Tax=Eupeodes corollae TaxID=290404 RepID=UPI002492627C|nr:protein doublesex isoform X2 [Eupeodes corollae]